MADDHYYAKNDLARFGEIGEHRPDLSQKFFDYYGEVFKEGALSAREKALMALAVAHALQCPYCIDAYTKSSLQKGADQDQLTETVHVASAIRGAACLVHGIQMKNVADAISM